MGKKGNPLTKTADGFDAIYTRICGELGIRTQVELAAALGIRQSSISDAKRRGAIPADWQLTLLETFGLNPTWLRTGQGPKCLVQTGSRIQPQGNIQQVQVLFDEFTRSASAAMGLGTQA